MLAFEMHLLEQDSLMAFIKSNYLSNTSILKSRKDSIMAVHEVLVNTTSLI